MRVVVPILVLTSFVLSPLACAATHPASASAPSAVPAYITKAIDDPARSADRHIDARRKMAAVMTFTGVKPGDVVVELVPGTGYWTRVFSQVVGPSGHVYTIWPTQMLKYYRKGMLEWRKLSATPHYANVSVLEQPAQEVTVPVKADIVFTADNYHDYHNIGISIAAFDRSVFAALKPGGVFIVVDHAAPAGSGISDTDTLHRIDPAATKREVEAAGFVFAGSSNALANPADPLDIRIFDKSIRGHTDQFIFRFRKPAAAGAGAQ